jgi:hypothetical protein
VFKPQYCKKTKTTVSVLDLTKDFSGSRHLVRPKFLEHCENLWGKYNEIPEIRNAVNAGLCPLWQYLQGAECPAEGHVRGCRDTKVAEGQERVDTSETS